MGVFKPQAHVVTRQGNSYRTYPTYKLLKKDLVKLINLDEDSEGLFVVRSRRGEWGEWFERWGLDSKGKPYIIKQGWN